MKQINPILFETLCNNVAIMTDENDHTGAKLEVARFFELKPFIKVFEAIETIHDFEGSMPIGEYRSIVGKRMMQTIKNEYGEAIYNQLSNSF